MLLFDGFSWLRRCESGRILIVVSRLRDDLLAGVPALAGVARLGLVGMLSGQVDVARFRLRRRVVRLPGRLRRLRG